MSTKLSEQFAFRFQRELVPVNILHLPLTPPEGQVVTDTTAAETLPLLLNRPESFFEPHVRGRREQIGIDWDLTYLPNLVAVLRERCGDVPDKAAREIRLFDVIISECNAVVAPNGHDYEIGFFMGLRDCLFETTNLIFSFDGFMKALLGPSSVQPKSFACPLPGFENFFAFDADGFPFAPVLPPPLHQYPRPTDPTRLRNAQFYRLSAEQLIWLHEYAHVFRGHFMLLDNMSASASALSESVPVGNAPPQDGFLAFLRRALEHDADWEAYRVLMHHMREDAANEDVYAGALATLSSAQQMIFSIFMIFSANARSPLGVTHPHPFLRSTFIGRRIFHEFGGSSIETQMYLYGVREWRKAADWLGWGAFLEKHCPAMFAHDDLAEYFQQVDTLLESIDRVCRPGQPSGED